MSDVPELVERVTRALMERWQFIAGAAMKPDEVYWRRMAEIAIAAMRVPTAKMIDAMRDVGPDAPYGVSETADRWRAGVDAALS